MSMIDDNELRDTTAAELDDAPFPEASRIPSATVTLEEADAKPDAFGDDSSAAPTGVEDAVIEESDGGDVPVTYEEAAQALGSNDAGNEFGNSSVSPEQPVAGSTNAETLNPASEVSSEEGVTPKKVVRGGGRKMGGMKPASDAKAAE